MDVAELNAHLKAEVGGFLRNLESADLGMDETERHIRSLERTARESIGILNDIKVSQAQAFESKAALLTIERSISDVSHTALVAADYLNNVKVSQAQAAETKVATSSIKSDLDGVILKAEETRLALRRATSGGGGGSDGGGFLAGVLPGGARPRPGAVAALAGAALSTMPVILPATLGLAAGGADALGALAGQAGVALIALHGITAEAFSQQKAFDALDDSQKKVVTDLRSLGAGLGSTLKQIAEQNVLPKLSQGLHEAMSDTTVSAVTADMQAMSQATGQVADEWGRFLGGPFGTEFGTLLQRDAGYIAPLNHELMSMLDFTTQLLNVGGPFTDWLSRSIETAARGAAEWSHSADGVHDLSVAFDEAKSGLQTLDDLGGGFLDVLAAIYRATAGGANPAVEVLATGLHEVADIIDENRTTIADFFEGGAAAAHDIVHVIQLVDPLLHGFLTVVDDIANGLGGWRTVIDAAAVGFVLRFAAMKAGVDGVLAKILLIGPETAGATAEADAALASLTAAAAEAAAAISGIGVAAVEGATVVEGAMAAETAAVAETAGAVAVLSAGLLGIAAIGTIAVTIAIRKLLEPDTNVTPVAPGTPGGGAQGGSVFMRNGKWYQTMSGGKSGVVTREITAAQAAALNGGNTGAIADVGDAMRGASANRGYNYGPAYYKRMAQAAAVAAGVPPSLFDAQIGAESGFNPNAVSKAGAKGIAQFMPSTAKGLGVDPLQPQSALTGAAKLMASYYKKYGRWDLALAAYNGGPGAVDYYLKHGFYPSAETTNYVSSIMAAGGVPAVTSPFGTPSALTQDPTKKTGVKTGLGLLPTGLAVALQNAEAAAASAGGSSGVGGGMSSANLAQVISANKAVVDQAQKALDYLNQQKASGKELVNIARERVALEKEISSASSHIAAAQKQQQQNATAAKERSILGLDSSGAAATPTVIALRAQAAAMAKQITAAAADGIDVTDAQAQLAKLQKVLKFNFIPPDVRSAVATQIASLKQTISQGLADALADAKAALSQAASDFETGFGQVDSAADAAFAANVNAHVQTMQDSLSQALAAMQVMVTGPYGGFLFGGSATKTPAQLALEALQDSHTQQQLNQQLSDAQAALAKAQSGSGTIVDVATGTIVNTPPDQDAVKAAQQQVSDAQYALDQYNLQKKADLEQQAAQDQLSAAQDAYQKEQQAAIAAYQAQQQIAQTAMDQQVAAIVSGMESGAISADAGMTKIKAIWSSAGIDLGSLSFALGGQIYTGLAAGLAPIFALLKTLVDDLTKVATLSGTPIPDPTAAGIVMPGAGARGGTFTAFGAGGLITSPHWLVDAATGQVTGKIGESGTEAVVPMSSSSVTGPRAGARVAYGGGGGGGDVYVSVTFTGPVLGTPEELARAITPTVRTELIKIGRANGNQIFGGL